MQTEPADRNCCNVGLGKGSCALLTAAAHEPVDTFLCSQLCQSVIDSESGLRIIEDSKGCGTESS
eukprot:2811086-Amphidinium_carterae.1